jgi:hypothetical protein
MLIVLAIPSTGQIPRLLSQKPDSIVSDSVTTFPFPIIKFSKDRANNLYLVDIRGNLYKLDSTGKILFTNSADRPTLPSSIEAWPTLRIWLFYQEFQEYRVFDRLLNNQDVQKIPNTIGYARLFSPSADDNFWLLDDEDFSLKKINPKTGQANINQPMALLVTENAADFIYIKEYQNQLLLLNKSGTPICLDNMANIRKTIKTKPNIDWIDTWQNQVYWTTSSGLAGQDLYTGAAWQLPIGNVPLSWLAGRWIYCCTGKKLRRIAITY